MLSVTTAKGRYVLQSKALHKEVEMEVVFGTPSKNCAGVGVCFIAERLPQTFVIACPHAPARIFCRQQELIFCFQRQHISGPAFTAFFGRALFEVEEAFRLPTHLRKMLDIATKWVPPGMYPVEYLANEWRLRIPVTMRVRQAPNASEGDKSNR